MGGVWTGIRSWWGRVQQRAVARSAGTSGWSALVTGQHTPPAKGVSEWLAQFGDLGWLPATLRRIADDIAAVDWWVELPRPDGTADRLPDHPALALWNAPVPRISGMALRKLLSLYLDLAGEFFLVKDRNAAGQVVELWPMPPSWVLTTPTRTHAAFKVLIQGTTYQIPETEMIWSRHLHPANPFGRGLGVARAVGDDVEADEFAQKWNKRLFANSARPDFVITVKGKIDKPSAERLKEQWMQKHSGFWNAFKPAVLDNEATITPLGWGQREMDFVQLRKLARDNILGGFGVPLSVMGITENVNRANAEAGEYTYAKRVLVPRLVLLQEMAAELLLEFPQPPGARFVFADPVPDDKQHLLQVVNDGLQRGALTVNEWRSRMGFPTLPSGGDVLLTPISALPQDLLPEERGIRVRVLEEPPPSGSVVTAAAQRRVRSDEEWERRWKAFVFRAAPQEKSLRATLRSLFTEQEEAVQARLRSQMRAVVPAGGNGGVGVATKDVIADVFGDEADWGTRFVKRGRPHLEQALTTAGKAAVEEIGVGIAFDVTNPRARRFLDRRLAEYLGQRVQETTLADLRRHLGAGLEAGETIDQLSARVADVFDMARDFRAERIARTEIISAANAGSLEGYRQAGVKRKSWLAALDERTRETHVAAHQRYQANPIPVDQDFEVGGASGPAPGSINDPAESINCRCTLIAEVDE